MPKIILFLFMLGPGLVYTQCDIIKYGMYDYSSSQSYREKSSSFLSWYKNKDIKTFSEAKSISGNAIIPLEVIMLDMGFTYDERGFGEFQSYVESYVHKTDIQKSKLEQAIKRINPEVVKAWSDCINGYGVHIWVEHTENPYEFVLCANFIDDGGGGTSAQITSLDFGGGGVKTSSNVFYSNGSVNKETVLSASVKRQIFIRKNDAAFNLVVNVNRGKGLFYPFSAIKVVDTLPECPELNVEIFEETSDKSNMPSARVTIPKGYKIIGGGAKVNYSNGAGCLLTESYPDGGSWVAKAKAHLVNFNATITAYALAIYDPNDQWDIRVFQNTGPTSNTPEATVSVDEGYVLSGGGVKSNWSGAGILVTASYPTTSNTWRSKGKAHGVDERANITVYAIGIRPRHGCSKKLTNKIFQSTSDVSLEPTGHMAVHKEYMMTCGGVLSNWRTKGSLLTSSWPLSKGAWSGSSKAHEYAEKVSLDVYSIGVRFQ